MQQAPITPEEARAQLDERKDPAICRMFGCSNPKQPRNGTTGKHPEYCTEHDRVQFKRARNKLEAIASRQQQSTVRIINNLESIRESALRPLLLATEKFNEFVDDLIVLTDPELSIAEAKAKDSEVNIKIAEAQLAVDSAHALHLKAEQVAEAAREAADAEREAAAIALQQKDTAEKKVEEIRAIAAENVRLLEQKQIEAIKGIRLQADDEIQTAQEAAAAAVQTAQAQARQAIDQAERQVKAAQAQARDSAKETQEAQAQAREAEAREKAKVEAAEQSLARERQEVERLRKEIADLNQRNRVQLQEVKEEAMRQEARSKEEASQLHADLAQLRADITDTREQAKAASIRADQQAVRADALSIQLAQSKKNAQPPRSSKEE